MSSTTSLSHILVIIGVATMAVILWFVVDSNFDFQTTKLGNFSVVETVNVNSSPTANANQNADEDSEVVVDLTDETTSPPGFLTIMTPGKDEEVSSPFVVHGTSSATTVYVRIKSSGGTEIFTVPVNVKNGEYDVNLEYSFTTTESGFVDVYEKGISNRESNLVSVAVTFQVADEDTNTNSTGGS